jgi:succinate dehydrogenase/fumarate reductase flavoprotein subunit
MPLENLVETDVLVVGGGQAGLFAAIKACERGATVTLVDKGYAGKAGQTMNICTIDVFDPQLHDLDAWVKSGHTVNEYLDNPEWVELVFRDSLDRWNDLCAWGLKSFKFDKDGNVFVSPAGANDGEQAPGEGGLGGTGEGRPVTPVRFRFFPPGQRDFMRRQALKVGVRIIDRLTITDLIKQDGKIAGAIGISADSCDTYILQAKAVVLSTGNSGIKTPGIRTNTTTGDAQAMAYRVGCELTGKEWADYHPARADFPAYAWSSGIDRDFFVPKHKLAAHHGIPMYNSEGGRLDSMRPDEELKKKSTGQIFEGAAMVYEAHSGRAPLYFEVANDPNTAPMNHSPKDMPREEIDETAMKQGRVRMVLGRAAGQSHHLSDGVWPLDTSCATQVPGLYAAGDCLGARPGYAMAGFAAAFCSVTGARAGTSAAEYAVKKTATKLDKDEVARLKEITWAPMERKGGFTPGWVNQVILNSLTPYWVLYFKHADRLQAALTQVEFMRDNIVPKLMARDTHELRLAHEVKSIILHAEMKLRASMFRTESRWTHYREDYPRRDDPSWLAWVKIKDEDGVMKLSKEPVPQKWWPDLSLPYEERYPMEFPGEAEK